MAGEASWAGGTARSIRGLGAGRGREPHAFEGAGDRPPRRRRNAALRRGRRRRRALARRCIGVPAAPHRRPQTRQSAATERTGVEVPDAVAALLRAAVLQRIQLPFVGRQGSASLLASALGGAVDPLVARRSWTLTQGNVRYLRSLVEHHVRSGQLRRADGMWAWASGLTNREIAERLQLSVRTVEGHLYRAAARVGARKSQRTRQNDLRRPGRYRMSRRISTRSTTASRPNIACATRAHRWEEEGLK